MNNFQEIGLEFLNKLAHYVFDVLLLTAEQILLMLGPLLLLAYIINFVSRITQNLGFSVFGEKVYLYGFAWLGVAVHEISHAIFVVIFGHKLHKIVLFSPKPDGTLGYVEHSYNKKNIYQNIGNFFIGLGPVIFGPILLYFTLLFFLGSDVVDNVSISFKEHSFTSIDGVIAMLQSVLKNSIYLSNTVYLQLGNTYWLLAVFIFVIFSVGSSISMSNSDIKGSSLGFFYFLALLTIFNMSTLWFGDYSSNAITFMEDYIALIYPIIILSIIINLILAIVLMVLNISKFVMYLAIIVAVCYACVLMFL